MTGIATSRALVAILLLVALGCGKPGANDARAPSPHAAPISSGSAAPAPAGSVNSDGTRKHLPPGPRSEPPFTLVLQYDDFGPGSMATPLLGDAWWAWERGGSFAPEDAFDIRVVVFHGRTLADVRAKYPTVRGESDYRLVERDAALRYLDQEIAELADTGPDEGDFAPLLRRLQVTRRSILAGLAP